MARGGEHYIPRPDGGFSAWAANYYAAVKKWWTIQGLDLNDLKPLGIALDAWNAAYPAHTAARQKAESARRAKAAARAALEKEARPVANFVQAYPTTTNSDRAEMGITVRDAGGAPGGAPTSKPLILVESASRLTHGLRLVDEATPTRRARPRGVQRAEVFVALTPVAEPPPADPGVYRYVQSVSDGSTVLSFESRRGGMQAHYLARWVTRRGAMGPWSDTASATVAA